MNTPYWSLPTPNIDALIKHKKGSQMTDKKLEEPQATVRVVYYCQHRVPDYAKCYRCTGEPIYTEEQMNDLLKQERNKVLDEVDEKVIGEDIPEGTAWDRNNAGDRRAINIILESQREAIKKLKEE